MMAGDMVVTWNNYLIDAIRSDTTSRGPTWASRNMAIVQTAVYDAVNAIAQTHSSYQTAAKAPTWASKEAAVATAAHDTIVALYPQQKTKFDTLWTQSLATIANGAAENAGVAIGRQVAGEMLALRQDDGAYDPVEYTPSNEPGHWQPDPLNPSQTALGPNWGQVTTFAIQDPNDFQVAPPPALDSAAYAAAYNEVKSLGALHSTTRTADQTQVGVFWAYDRGGMGPPMTLYNQAVQAVAAVKRTSLVDNARLFALVNIAMADQGIAAWNTKYTYDFWRPITAIRQGDVDGNAATVADPNWKPLGAPGAGVVPDFTPPFPAYVSGHAGFGEATFRTMANFFGSDNLRFTLRSDELPGVTRTYTKLSQASIENALSRLYLGVHWRFDSDIGVEQGRQVADYVSSKFLVKLPANRASLGVQLEGGGYATQVLPGGAANIAIRRQDDRLQVVNANNNQVLFQTYVPWAHSIRFQGVNRASDIVTVDEAHGGQILLPGGLLYQGGAGENDRFWYAGTGGADQVTLDGNVFTSAHLWASFSGVTYFGMAGHGGDDVLTVKGAQTGRRIDLLGMAGDDVYNLNGTAMNLLVNEQGGGRDRLDFSQFQAGLSLDLALNRSQRQTLSPGVTLQILGGVEDVVGTRFNDLVRGNELANTLRGGGGDDRLFGRAGDDALYGDDGNDLLLGEAGDDQLYGGAGRDLLIGGLGRDRLDGQGDENILIGGSTTFDANDAALASLLAEWAMPRSRAARIANLTNGTGSSGRKNGSNFLTTTGPRATVRNDNAVDQILGDAAVNWAISS